MTREQAKKKLVDLGIEEPTEEQVTKYLDTVSEATKSEKAKNEQLKAENDQLKEENGQLGELRAQIEEAENSKLSEMDKLSKALETANSKIAEFEKKDIVRTLREEAMENYKISAEQAKQIVDDTGKYNAVLLGQIISEKETNAVSEYEKQKLVETQNPGGVSAFGSGDNNLAVELAKSSAQRLGGVNEDILNYYRR